MGVRIAAFCFAAVLPFGALAYDLVIANGRVMDPASGFDGIANIGVDEGRVATITTQELSGDRSIDASGLVVAPGFIDLHAHGQDAVSNRFQAADGVTTALELEIGVPSIPQWYESRSGNAPINFGATASHPWCRAAALGLSAAEALTSAAYQPVSDDQRLEMLNCLRAGIGQGALGIGMGITYTPAADHEEILRVFELAAELQRPVFVHMRNRKFFDGDFLGPLQEVLTDAVVTGASLHVVHINSSMDEQADVAVDMIRALRDKGLDITTENYPYTAGSTRLESALFDGWTDFGSLQWVATGERLTKETFEQYRRQGGWVIIHGRSETMNAWLVEQPDLIIASDGIPFVDGLSHPRSAGTFSKILGTYVRERQRLTLMQALAKMTIIPARRLDAFVPAMRNKGRLAEGADADITIFDPATVADRATYTEPAQYAAGIEYVLVGGEAVVSHGEIQENALPGMAVRVPMPR